MPSKTLTLDELELELAAIRAELEKPDVAVAFVRRVERRVDRLEEALRLHEEASDDA